MPTTPDKNKIPKSTATWLILWMAGAVISMLLSTFQFEFFECNYARFMSFLLGTVVFGSAIFGILILFKMWLTEKPATAARIALTLAILVGMPIIWLGAGYMLLLTHMCP